MQGTKGVLSPIICAINKASPPLLSLNKAILKIVFFGWADKETCFVELEVDSSRTKELFFFFLIYMGCPGQLTRTTTIPHGPLDILQVQEQVRHRGGDRRAHRGSNPGRGRNKSHDWPQQLGSQVRKNSYLIKRWKPGMIRWFAVFFFQGSSLSSSKINKINFNSILYIKKWI